MDPLAQIRQILESSTTATPTQGNAGESQSKQAGNTSEKKMGKAIVKKGKLPTKNAETVLTPPGTEESKKAQNATGKAKFPTSSQSGAGPKMGKLSGPARSEEVEVEDENLDALDETSVDDETTDEIIEDDVNSDGEEVVAENSSDGDETSDVVEENEEQVQEDKAAFLAMIKAKAAKKKDDKKNDKSEKSDDGDGDDEADDKKKDKKSDTAEESVHLDALFTGETLTEDFKAKAKTIFEAALAERETAIAEQVANDYAEAIAEGLVEVRAELTEQLDSYLDYIAEQWIAENALQVENGLKLEITESFLNGLRGLFLEHDIEVPESQSNLVEELADKVSELEEQLSTEMNANVELAQKLEEFRKNEAIAELGEELASTQFEKFVELCEGVAFENVEDFTKKAQIIKENYFKKGGTVKPVVSKTAEKTVLSESALVGDGVEEDAVVSEETQSQDMSNYIGALSRLAKVNTNGPKSSNV